MYGRSGTAKILYISTKSPPIHPNTGDQISFLPPSIRLSAVFGMESGPLGIDCCGDRGSKSQEPSQCLKPPSPELLAGDIRLRLSRVGSARLLYQVVAALSVFLGLILAVFGLGKADLSISDLGERKGFTLAATGTVIFVSGAIISKLLRGW